MAVAPLARSEFALQLLNELAKRDTVLLCRFEFSFQEDLVVLRNKLKGTPVLIALGFGLAEGLLKPLIFLTNCREAARTSCSVTGGSKLKSVLMFRHMRLSLLMSMLDSAGRPQRRSARIFFQSR